MPTYGGMANPWVSGQITRGIVYGLIHRVPASGLTVTYDPGLVRVGSAAQQPTTGSGVVEYRIAGSTKAFTASKDTYVYVDLNGTLQYLALANGADFPRQDDIGQASELLCKVVSSSTDVTAITSYAQTASHGPFDTVDAVMSFAAAGVGATCNFHTPYAGRIVGIEGTVAVAIAATDAGTITAALGLNDVYTNVTNGVITAAISDAIGVRYSIVPSANHYFTEGQTLRLTSAKTTAGGEVNVTIYLEPAPLAAN